MTTEDDAKALRNALSERRAFELAYPVATKELVGADKRMVDLWEEIFHAGAEFGRLSSASQE
jgi:hypothetical protein